MMTSRHLAAASVAILLAWAPSSSARAQQPEKPAPSRKPHLSLRARPEFGIAPLRVALTAEFTGGDNDFEEFYCPTVVWEWGDGSASEASSDCVPYEAGKSQITRRYTKEHVYERSGTLRAYFSLRRRDKEVAAAGVNITVMPGGRDNSQ
jgi:hypothetical protein